MLFNMIAGANPPTGNTSAGVYIIIVSVAAVLIVGAVVSGIITKKKK